MSIMQRVKYKLNLITQRHESKPILTEHGFVIAEHYGSHWAIRHYDGGALLTEGDEQLNSKAKRRLKKELIAMGANFNEEIRAKKS